MRDIKNEVTIKSVNGTDIKIQLGRLYGVLREYRAHNHEDFKYSDIVVAMPSYIANDSIGLYVVCVNRSIAKVRACKDNIVSIRPKSYNSNIDINCIDAVPLILESLFEREDTAIAIDDYSCELHVMTMTCSMTDISNMNIIPIDMRLNDIRLWPRMAIRWWAEQHLALSQDQINRTYDLRQRWQIIAYVQEVATHRKETLSKKEYNEIFSEELNDYPNEAPSIGYYNNNAPVYAEAVQVAVDLDLVQPGRPRSTAIYNGRYSSTSSTISLPLNKTLNTSTKLMLRLRDMPPPLINAGKLDFINNVVHGLSYATTYTVNTVNISHTYHIFLKYIKSHNHETILYAYVDGTPHTYVKSDSSEPEISDIFVILIDDIYIHIKSTDIIGNDPLENYQEGTLTASPHNKLNAAPNFFKPRPMKVRQEEALPEEVCPDKKVVSYDGLLEDIDDIIGDDYEYYDDDDDDDGEEL